MVRKKSKYRHISINKKKYYFYHIIWLDILGDSSHLSYSEFEKMRPATMNTYAYEETFSDRNVFPIGCIKELKKIEI